jgi:diphthamide synthase subunit DPH2
MHSFDAQALLAARGIVPLECDIAFFARCVEKYKRSLDPTAKSYLSQLSVLAERIVLCRLVGMKGPERKKRVIDQLKKIRESETVLLAWVSYPLDGLASNLPPYKASGLI